MPFYDDYSLEVWSPMNEPSGTPLWANLAPKWNVRPSGGLALDWHVHVTQTDTNASAVFPGGETVEIAASGAFYHGYKVQGTADIVTDTLIEKCLVLGNGYTGRRTASVQEISGSGFTVGFWVLPQTSGPLDSLSPAQRDDYGSMAEDHAIISKGSNTAASSWIMGVSGSINRGAEQNNVGIEDLLSAYAFVGDATASVDANLSVPIEAERFSHITFVFEHQDPVGTINSPVKLYKDGVLQSQDTVRAQLTAELVTYADELLVIGGSTAGTDRYNFATGWGHIISGVYVFHRPLSDSDVSSLHNEGGINATAAITLDATKPVTLDDPNLLLYVPGLTSNGGDVTNYHHNLFLEDAENTADATNTCPGPFGHTMIFDDSNTTFDVGLITPSGITKALIDGDGSFSIGGWFVIDGVAGAASTIYDDTILMSFGTIGTGAEYTPTRTDGGMIVALPGNDPDHRITARFFEDNIVDGANNIDLQALDSDPYGSVYQHVGVVYDAQTQGVALYVDGIQQQSGVIPTNWRAAQLRLLGSGFPFVFLNGVIDGNLFSATAALSASATGDNACGDMFLASRPFLPSEMRYMAVSGIQDDLNKLHYTVNDSRLRGYWQGTEPEFNGLLVPDRSMHYAGTDPLPANMCLVLPDASWDRIVADSTTVPQLNVDLYTNHNDPVLGFTSGNWAVDAGGDGSWILGPPESEYSRSVGAFPYRFAPMTESRSSHSPGINQQVIWSFEVTPSGTIPVVFGSDGEVRWNSTLMSFGDDADYVQAYLTTANEPAGSGVSLVWHGVDGTSNVPLCSGNVSYGDTSRVLLHFQTVHAGIQDHAPGNTARFTMYLDGIKENVVEMPWNSSNFWSVGTTIGSTNDWILQIGGRAALDTPTSHNVDDNEGLGEIFLRNAFVMVGDFTDADLLYLATSGIRSGAGKASYDTSLTLTDVTTTDPDLFGYWRFSGPDAASGVTDLSIAGNDLDGMAARAFNEGLMNNIDNSFSNLRFFPLPFLGASQPTQASGISYVNAAPNASAANSFPPYAFSGAQVDASILAGFSVGFWCSWREIVATNDIFSLLSYGPVPTSNISSVDTDSSWAIYLDELEDVVMHLSGNGVMYYDHTANASRAGQITVGSFGDDSIGNTQLSADKHKVGFREPPHVDSLVHYVFTYDNFGLTPGAGVASGVAKAYVNGELVDTKIVQDGIRLPVVEENRMISVLQPANNTWDWGNTTRGAWPAVMSDLFWMNRALTDAEVRSIAHRGIVQPVATATSGFLGGFILAVDGRTALLGGYMQGQDTGSGIMAGYMQGAERHTGNMAGYMHGQDFGSGVLAGYMQGTLISSGVLAGYIFSTAQRSDVFAGYINGSLSGLERFDAGFSVSAVDAADFDAQIELSTQIQSEFDAELIIFDLECPPNIAIIAPDLGVSGVNTPLNQYFVGSGQAQSPKTIVKGEWFFSDFTGTHEVSASGSLYPISHVFSQSGYYVARFTLTDSAGLRSSEHVLVNLASGVSPVGITLSGVPQQGVNPLDVAFTKTLEYFPAGVTLSQDALNFNDGSTESTGALTVYPEADTHTYSEPGSYRPIWLVRDSRGLIWSDTLRVGVDLEGTS